VVMMLPGDFKQNYDIQRFVNGAPTTASKESLYMWRVRRVPYRVNGNKERDTLAAWE
jgi:hypothetical protein